MNQGNLKVSIIIPIVDKEGAKRCIEAIQANAGVSDFDYEIIMLVDNEHIGCPKMVSKLVELANHDWIMFLADDTEPQENFLSTAIITAEENPGCLMVGLNDNFHNGDSLATHWMAHKDLLKLTGGEFFHTGYNHLYCDNELIDIAKENDAYMWAKESKLKHHHPLLEGKELTNRYKSLYEGKKSKADHRLYLERREARKGIIIGIGEPLTDDYVHKSYHRSFVMLNKPYEYYLIEPDFRYHKGDIAKCRNDLCKVAINLGCTHILMMDTDQVYRTKDMIAQMISHGKPVVGAKVHRRYEPYEPILQRGGKHVPDEEIKAGGLVPVDSTGAGCLLIKIATLTEIDYPWFETTYNKNGSVEAGEDVNFCRKLKKAGIDIFVDCDIEIGHLAIIEINSDFQDAYKHCNGG